MVGWTAASSNLFAAVIFNIDPLESTKKEDEIKAKWLWILESLQLFPPLTLLFSKRMD